MADVIEIMQGDEYDVDLGVKCLDGEQLSGDDVSKLEVCIGELSYIYPASMRYDDETGRFVLHLTQEDTFSMIPGTYTMQMRIKSLQKDVIGKWDLRQVRIIKSRSKVIL